MTRWMPAAAAIGIFALAAPAFAGDVSLSKVSGGVLVNQGHGFRPATPGMTLHPGDRVLVTTTGGATINWGGCGASLGAGSMATISNATPCTNGARAAGVVTPGGSAQPGFKKPPPVGGGGGGLGGG